MSIKETKLFNSEMIATWIESAYKEGHTDGMNSGKAEEDYYHSVAKKMRDFYMKGHEDG